MQRVIIVDFSNLRENRPGRMRVVTRIVEGVAKRITLASWSYIEEALLELAAAAPGSTICLVADKGIRYDFEEPNGREIFDTLRRESCDSFWYLYVMPTRRELAEMRNDENFEFGMQADDLILYLASELDGFVLSRDFFRDDRYQPLLNKFGHRVFWPAKKLDDSGWGFAKSTEVRQEDAHRRNHSVATLTQLSDAIASAPLLNAEQSRVMKESICGTGGLIDRFWLEYFERHTSKSDTQTAPRTVVIHPPSVRKVRRPKPAITTNASTSFVDVVKEQLGLAPPSDDGVDDDRKIEVVLACHQLTLSAAVGTTARLVGRVRQHGSELYLEWYPGDKKVLISREMSMDSHMNQGFVGVVGRLNRRGERYELKPVSGASVAKFGFEDILEMLNTNEQYSSGIKARRWSLPSLPRRRRVSVATAGHYVPLVPKAPPPGRATTSTTRLTPTDSAIPPIPTPPRISARLRTLIAIATGVIAVLVAALVSVLR